MCRTEQARAWLAVGVGALALLVGGSQAQTLGDVAEAQRAKVLAEVAAAQIAANPPATKPQSQEGVTMRKAVRTARIVLHSLYARGTGGWTAELTDGQTLTPAAPGMRYGNQVVARIDAQGLHLIAAEDCKQACPLARVVRLGGEL